MMTMNKIKYFALEELLHTDSGKANVPSWAEFDNLMRLGEFLDGVRADFGAPISINSAYRSEAVNQAVGGSKTSAHRLGLAADIHASRGTEMQNRLLLAILEQRLGSIDQLISYHKVPGDRSSEIRFIHVGLAKSGSPRCQRLYK